MSWWQYLILVNIYLLLFYSFYVILLSRETFFQLNRIYLVAASILSFVIPVIQSQWVKGLFITQKVQYTLYTSPVMFYQFKPIKDTHITIGQILIILYLSGILLLTLRLAWQLFVLKRVIDQPQPDVAYSFFKKIRLGEKLENNRVIAAHEGVHASQWHSIDVLMIEAVMIINWFNPVVYFYRRAIKHIHEFIADNQAIKSGTTKEAYALLLLSQTFNTTAHQLVNPFFSQSLLKKRVKMLQKSKSRYTALIKYGLSAPLFIMMLILSSATVNNSRPVRLFNTKVEQVFLTPAAAVSMNGNIADENFSVSLPGKKSIVKAPPKALVKIDVVPSFADTVPAKDNKVFTAVETIPEFPGGISAFGEFLGRNIRYPADSRRNSSQGRVIVSFVVEKTGELTNFHVVRSVDSSIDREAVRVLRMSPKWSPGTQNGKLVRVAYSVPIAFTLDDIKVKNGEENKFGVISDKVIIENAMVTKPDTIRKSPFGPTKADPLYIIDGKESDGLKNINVNDIESISVLKDKTATAIYGAKAANGVVIVALKKLRHPAVQK